MGKAFVYGMSVGGDNFTDRDIDVHILCKKFLFFFEVFQHLQPSFCLTAMSIANDVYNDVRFAFLARKD